MYSMSMRAVIAPICAMGPSEPAGRPEATEQQRPRTLTAHTFGVSAFGMLQPLRKAITPGTPDEPAPGCQRTPSSAGTRNASMKPVFVSHAAPRSGAASVSETRASLIVCVSQWMKKASSPMMYPIPRSSRKRST